MRLTLKAALERKRLTPEMAAERCKVHRATVYRLLANQITNPSNATVNALEDGLGLKRGTLVFGAEAEEAMERAS